jgi:hypothetical protein
VEFIPKDATLATVFWRAGKPRFGIWSAMQISSFTARQDGGPAQGPTTRESPGVKTMAIQTPPAAAGPPAALPITQLESWRHSVRPKLETRPPPSLVGIGPRNETPWTPACAGVTAPGGAIEREPSFPPPRHSRPVVVPAPLSFPRKRESTGQAPAGTHGVNSSRNHPDGRRKR